MKFLFITRESYREPGARIRCYKLSEKLREKGLNADVFSFVDKLTAKVGKDEIDFSLIEKLKLIFQGYRFISQEADNSVFIINRFNYHAVSTGLAAFFKKVPFIFDMDDWEMRENISYYLGLFPRSKAEYFTHSLAKNSIFCIAASSYLKDYLLQFNRNVYYLPTGVDIEEFKPSLYNNRSDLIFSWHGSVNRVEVIKYIKFIIDCFLIISKKYPFIQLRIAGDGIFIKDLVKLIKSYHCENIIYYGWIYPQNISRYLDDIDIGLIPLLDKTRFNLSKSPVKLFEYMAKAKPVVASDIGEAAKIIKDGINGFLTKTKEEFINKMQSLIENVNLRMELGNKARQTVITDYSFQILAERFYNILSQINV